MLSANSCAGARRGGAKALKETLSLALVAGAGGGGGGGDATMAAAAAAGGEAEADDDGTDETDDATEGSDAGAAADGGGGDGDGNEAAAFAAALIAERAAKGAAARGISSSATPMAAIDTAEYADNDDGSDRAETGINVDGTDTAGPRMDGADSGKAAKLSTSLSASAALIGAATADDDECDAYELKPRYSSADAGAAGLFEEKSIKSFEINA
jgi:hypothetical protein